MIDAGWFEADVGDDFEESVRIDRADDGRDHRLNSIDTYHVTDEAEHFMTDFFSRLLGESEDMRSGANYWLYGYYGSGKSHLLTVLRGLMDSEWVESQPKIWGQLEDGQDLDSPEKTWNAIHENYDVIPISVNLLKYQGQKQRSFSEIILRAAHGSERLTGVEGGLSSQLDVAYFEDWYRTIDAWDNRTDNAQQALKNIVDNPSTYEWQDVQQYEAVSEVVLPQLFEEETGTRDGLPDLTPSDLDPEAMVERLEKLRRKRDSAVDSDVKLVLLLDEVSLFIGTDFDRLTELQTLAENIDEVGDGNIQLVATAQAKIEDVQPQFGARGADFSIVKDRFPHRFGLPSRHVGEISTQRLLRKSDDGLEAVRDVFETTKNDPETLLVYSGVEQNTEPPLDDIDRQQLEQFYPFVPYQPSLFLELLSNLRQEAHDPAKSIFSGTARAILALVHGLLQEWIEEGEPTHTVSMVDFYDLIEPELEDITPQDVEVIEEIEADVETGELQDVDLQVAKAVLLLQHVPETIPMSERNIAVAILNDLDGPTRFQMENRVEESLGRLRKYIRETHEETGAKYGFAPREEREIIEAAQRNRENPEWDGVIKAVDTHLWGDIVRNLNLPTSAQYGDSPEQYPVRYEFSLDGIHLETTVEADDALDVEIAIKGVSPTGGELDNGDEPLEWNIGDEGIADLRDTLIEWWALRTAVGDNTVPDSIQRDLDKLASRTERKLVETLKNGSFSVRDRTGLRGLSTAISEFIDVRYPDDFHPTMLQIGEDHLRELRTLTAEDPLPEWAQRIEVATEAPETHGGNIQNNVRSFTGRQLKQRGGHLAMSTILDGIVEKKPIYEDARPALCAIIWGLCRKGDFLPIDETGDSLVLDSVIDLSKLTMTRLKISTGSGVREALIEGEYLEPIDTIPDGVARLQQANDQLISKLKSLAEEVELTAENDVESTSIRELLNSFVDTLHQKEAEAEQRAEAVKSGDTDWMETVLETNDAINWHENVKGHWEIRLPLLLQLDGQLTVAGRDFDWLTEDCQAAYKQLRKQMQEYDGEWYTTDGWVRFTDMIAVEPSLDSAIEDAWRSLNDSTNIDHLVNEIGSHPWIRPSSEFGANVRPAFESKYITPLRRLSTWYSEVDTAIATITSDPTNTEADEFVRATATLADTRSVSAETGSSVDDLYRTFEKLREIVGGRDPEDVNAIGIVPSDRDSLDAKIDRLAERRDLSFEVTDHGVIVR